MSPACQVRFGRDSGFRCTNCQNDAGAVALINKPSGMKYMLAMLCSKPQATKAVIGGTMAQDPVGRGAALKVSQTARQTSALQSMPEATACRGDNEHLLSAIVNAASPTKPLPRRYWPLI